MQKLILNVFNLGNMEFPKKEFDQIIEKIRRLKEDKKEIRKKTGISIHNYQDNYFRDLAYERRIIRPFQTFSTPIENRLKNFLFEYHTMNSSFDTEALGKISELISKERRMVWIEFINRNISQLKTKLPFNLDLTEELKNQKIRIRKRGLNLISEIEKSKIETTDKYFDFYNDLEEFQEKLVGLGIKWRIGILVTVWVTLVGGIVALIGAPYKEIFRNIGFFVVVIVTCGVFCALLGVILNRNRLFKILKFVKSKAFIITFMLIIGLILLEYFLLKSDITVLLYTGISIIGFFVIVVIIFLIAALITLIQEIIDNLRSKTATNAKKKNERIEKLISEGYNELNKL